MFETSTSLTTDLKGLHTTCNLSNLNIDGNLLTFFPDYRGYEYSNTLRVYVDGYSDQYVEREFILEERVLQSITFNIDDMEIIQDLKTASVSCNLDTYFQTSLSTYPYKDFIRYRTNNRFDSGSINDNDPDNRIITIDPDVRGGLTQLETDEEYPVYIEVYDYALHKTPDAYYTSNHVITVFENPPVILPPDLIDLVHRDLSNIKVNIDLTAFLNNHDINDLVFETSTSLTTDLKGLHTTCNLSNLDIDGNLLTFFPDYRGYEYSNTLRVYVDGYSDQYVEREFILEESNLPPIVFKNNGIDIRDLTVYNVICNVREYFNVEDYPYESSLRYRVSSKYDIEEVVNTEISEINNVIIRPDVRVIMELIRVCELCYLRMRIYRMRKDIECMWKCMIY